MYYFSFLTFYINLFFMELTVDSSLTLTLSSHPDSELISMSVAYCPILTSRGHQLDPEGEGEEGFSLHNLQN